MNTYAAVFNPQRASWYAKLVNRQGSRRLYVRLVYFDQIICRTTGLLDTQENREMLEPVIDKINREIATGHFIFEKAFPGAPEEERRQFAELEGRDFRPSLKEVTFGRMVEQWKESAWPHLPSEDAKRDTLSALDSRVAPWFGTLPMDKITPTRVKEFIRALADPTEQSIRVFSRAVEPKGRVKIAPLSAKRMRNILSAMRKVWTFACQEYGWELASPFEGINRYVTELCQVSSEHLGEKDLGDEELIGILDAMEKASEDQHPKGRVLLMSEVGCILPHLHPLYRPAAELMLLTGMIPSEVAALRNQPVGEHLLVRYSLSREHLKSKGKNIYRTRKIPVTTAIRRVLQEAAANAEDRPLLFRQIRGGYFNERVFRRAWYKACNAAAVAQSVPYSLRHTFEACCEVLGIPKYRIISLMGHADKSMVDRIYGKYREGIEHEYDQILDFFGRDFKEGRKLAAIPSGEKMAAACASSEQVGLPSRLST